MCLWFRSQWVLCHEATGTKAHDQENLAAALASNDRVHFGNAGVRAFLQEGLMILVTSAIEDARVIHFGGAGFVGLVFGLLWNVEVVNGQGTRIQGNSI